jgi:hypothetical protein
VIGPGDENGDEKAVPRTPKRSRFHLGFHLFHLFSSNSHSQTVHAEPLSSLDEKIAPFFHLFLKPSLVAAEVTRLSPKPFT